MQQGSLSKWWVVARRELRVSFQSPLAYILLALWMFIAGYFYVSILLGSGSSDMGPLVQNLIVLLLFIAPLLTMKLLAEERRAGTDELILTTPISPAQWVIGKYLGALGTWTLFTVASLIFPLVTSRLGAMAWGIVFGAYLGLWLFGAATLAAGLLATAVTDNQIVAAMLTFVIILFFYATSWIAGSVSGPISTLMQYVSMPNQFNNFSLGLITIRNLVYFVSVSVGFIFLAVRAVDMRRWA